MENCKSIFSAILVASLALTGCASKEPSPQEALVSNYLQALKDYKEEEAYGMVSADNPPTKEAFVTSNVKAPMEYFKVISSECVDEGKCEVITEIKFRSREGANDKNIINKVAFTTVKEGDKWNILLNRKKEGQQYNPLLEEEG
ncbi:putative DNA/RNA helicase [Brevibacillus phage SecTim467]|uniref:Putative DNA/RNA helicase n=2 Tax=Jenstvirus jenst TaxID=1982225 RepID=A0A0K2CPA2_9CAUD|nr:putative DNA/RNA helicase [Brevibacillus phage Jenst]ALA07191.1 putative DNA/RNA helicase [Brevibacillus phage Jenst]ALA07558.1 putative DNA/RNA helicase [Brevibacillus phage SecTim467]